MKVLDIFLKALQQTFDIKRGIYISKHSIEPTKVNCIDKHNVEVWLVDGNNKQLIADTTKNYNTEISTKDSIEEELNILMISNILKYYGL